MQLRSIQVKTQTVTTMSIARAFTTKRAKRDSPEAPQRSLTTKQSAGGIRNKISSPVELLSTTNMLSYNAPDLYPSSSPSTASQSTSEASDSDHKSISSVSTPPSSPDTEKATPEPNHLSCYFNVQPTPGLSTAKSTPDLKDDSAPKIPTRAPSHTKRSHESLSLSHKKSASKASSLSHKSSAPAMGMGHKASSSALRSSLQKFNSLHQQSVANSKQSSQPPPTPSQQIHAKQTSISMDSQFQNETPARSRPGPTQGLPTKPNQQMPPMQSRARSLSNSKSQPFQNVSHKTVESQSYAQHPFGNELAQVTELAEEFSGGKMSFADEESALMAEKGLRRFAADDYMSEIQGLFIKAFGEIRKAAVTDMWI